MNRILCLLVVCSVSLAGERARDLGIKIGSFSPGKRNAITDVDGVKVGHVTLESGSGKNTVRTGVTVVIPASGDFYSSKLRAGTSVSNGNAEAAGFMYINEIGVLESIIGLTNTNSVGTVQRGLIEEMNKRKPEVEAYCPVVMECDDSFLNDIRGQHVTTKHVFEAVAKASLDVPEGAVGAGTGMMSFDFKSGIGTASRVVSIGNRKYVLGILINTNLGSATRDVIRIAGVPLAKEFPDLLPVDTKTNRPTGAGSAVVVLATDAPLESRQLSRLAKRALHGIVRAGTPVYNGSGELGIAFSTVNRLPDSPKDPVVKSTMLIDSALNPLFDAAADATEEALINSLLGATTTTGINDHKVYALPHDRLKAALKKYHVVN